MRSRNQANLEMLRRVARSFGALCYRVVFVGGSVVDLLITDPGAPPVRGTQDVDVIVEVASLRDYYDLRDPLISLGFREDHTGDPAALCRWDIEGIKVDIMPTEGAVLGFSSRWYRVAGTTAVPIEIDKALWIRLVTAPSFLATKLEAFMDRGQGDFLGSHDLEDVIAVLDGRPEVMGEIEHSVVELKSFLVKAFQALLQDEDFLESISGHLHHDEASQARVSIVTERIKTIASMDIGMP